MVLNLIVDYSGTVNSMEELKQDAEAGKIPKVFIGKAEFVKAVHGTWIVSNGNVCCSECGEPNMEWNFCPFCGARMDGKEEEK